MNLLKWFGMETTAFADGDKMGGIAQFLGQNGAGGPGGLASMIPFVLMFVVMYFLMLRPQQKKMKEQQQMIAALKQGDEVVTSSGILGKIHAVQDKVVLLEIEDQSRLKLLKSQVAQVLKPNALT